MAAMIEQTCKNCKTVFSARVADVNRGWAQFCSKSCKAKTQTKRTGIAGPHFKAVGKTVQQMASGSYAKSQVTGRAAAPAEGIYRNGRRMTCEHCGDWATNGVHTNFETESGDGIEWTCDLHFDDTHPFSSDAHGQWG